MRSCRSCDMSRDNIKEILSATFAQKFLFKRSVQEEAIWDQCSSDLCPKNMSIGVYPRDCPQNMSKNYVHKNLSTGLSAKYVQKLFSATYPQKTILRAMHPGVYCPMDLSRNNFPGIKSRIFFIKMMPGYYSL